MAVHALLFNFEQSRVCHRLAKLIWPWTLQGVMVGEGISVSERRVYVGDSLARVAPTYQRSWQLNMRGQKKNPVPYSAEYPGHKMHIDQKEKLIMYVPHKLLQCTPIVMLILDWSSCMTKILLLSATCYIGKY